MRPSGTIFDQLVSIGAVSPADVELYSERTSDVEDLPVWRDRASGVIFISGHYVGDGAYRNAEYRAKKLAVPSPLGQDYEDHEDTTRRLRDYKRWIHDRRICDFGCGAGSFAMAARPLAASVCGVELQEDAAALLSAQGIGMRAHIGDFDSRFDTVFAFHVLEHMQDPLGVLADIRASLDPAHGRVVVEVPHARDALLELYRCVPFRDFTLWSQHLVLHTRDSLRRLLRAAGFDQIIIEGVQRYSLANHLRWLRDGGPGGHRVNLAMLETDDLRTAYAAALSSVDACDTLVAVASIQSADTAVPSPTGARRVGPLA